MNEKAIYIRGLYKSFGPTPVLENVDFVAEHGDFVGVIGPNGGGKTVLLKIILGLLKPDQGIVRVLDMQPDDAHGNIGYVPQYANFDSEFPIDVLDVVLTGRQSKRKLLKRYTPEDKDRANAALCKVDMQDFRKRQIGRLSGGQLQRVLIARALVTEPRLLLLDEPTANLDPMGGQTVYELLDKLRTELTVVLVSHDIGVISRYLTTVACVNRRLFQHAGNEPPRDIVEKTYRCPVHFLPSRPSDIPPQSLNPDDNEKSPC